MGRSKRGKKHRVKARAGVAPVPELPSRPEEATIKSTPLIEGLSSLSATERETCCVAVANVFAQLGSGSSGNAPVANCLIKKGLIKKLLHRIQDPCDRVRMHAAGALRNISASGDDEKVCVKMVADDALTPILAMCESSQPGKEEVAVLVEQLLSLLINLLTSVEAAVARFTSQGGATVMSMLLSRWGSRSAVIACCLEVMHVASDENIDLARQIASMEGGLGAWEALAKGQAYQEALPRLHAAGVLVNVVGLIGGEIGDGAEAKLISLVLPLVLSYMRYDETALQLASQGGATIAEQGEASNGKSASRVAASAAGGVLGQDGAGLMDEGGEEMAAGGAASGAASGGGGAEDDPAEVAHSQWKAAHVDALKLSAEVLTNLCALGKAAAADDEDEQEWGSDDEVEMEDIAVAGITDDALGGGAASPILQAIIKAQVLPAIVNGVMTHLFQPTPEEHGHHQLPGASSNINDLRITVSLCATSLLQSLPFHSLGDVVTLWKTCSGIMASLLALPAATAKKAVEAFSSTLWALVAAGGEEIAAAGLHLSRSTAEGSALLSLIQQLCNPTTCQSSEARVNGIGVLAILAGSPHDESTNRDVAETLLAAVEDEHVLVQAAALDAVMDIYADDQYISVWQGLGMLKKLEQGAAGFKAKVNQEGKAQGRDAWLHLKEALLNVSRFCKYKRKK
ncbi:unnamed protein product [Chrysoparadoxa australica]